MTSRSTPAEVVGVASASGRASEGAEEGELGDNAVVQSFWLGDELSPLEHLSAASFLAHGHQVLRREADAGSACRFCKHMPRAPSPFSDLILDQP